MRISDWSSDVCSSDLSTSSRRSRRRKSADAAASYPLRFCQKGFAMRRVVVTGLGLVTPLACGVEATWTRLINGESGLGPITRFDASEMPARIAGQVPLKADFPERSDAFDPEEWMEAKERKRVDDFIVYGLAAAKQAVKDSGWVPADEAQRCRTGVLIGSGIGGLKGIAEIGRAHV